MPLMRLAEVESCNHNKISEFNRKMREWQENNKNLPPVKYHKEKQKYINKLEE